MAAGVPPLGWLLLLPALGMRWQDFHNIGLLVVLTANASDILLAPKKYRGLSTNTMLGAPCYHFRMTGPKTLFILIIKAPILLTCSATASDVLLASECELPGFRVRSFRGEVFDSMFRFGDWGSRLGV